MFLSAPTAMCGYRFLMRFSPSTDLRALHLASLDGALHDQRQCFARIERALSAPSRDSPQDREVLDDLRALLTLSSDIADLAADLRDALSAHVEVRVSRQRRRAPSE